jgi:hypothetical protein
MNLNDLETRVQRLDQLSRGLAKEVLLWKECNDPLLYRERQDYLAAIRAALSGVYGWLSFYEGSDTEAEFKRIEKTGWHVGGKKK